MVRNTLAGLFVAMLSSSAMATLLAPGSTVAPSPTASPAGAALVVSSGAQPFASVDGTSFSGTLTTNVYTADAGNPFGLNVLTFTYLLTNAGPDALERLVTVNFQGYGTDVSVNGAFAGALPTSADRSANGRVVGWDYTGGPGIPGGGSSTLLVIHTDATLHVAVQNSVINGSVAVVNSFGPAPIPEPATLGLAGIATLGLVIRRRK
jgi:hypothetical protein